jgi:hypothetical protein
LKKFRVKSIFFFTPVVTGTDLSSFPTIQARLTTWFQKERVMSRHNTRTTGSSKFVEQEKLRAELADLGRAIEQMPLSKQISSREFELLAQKCNRLRLGFKVRPAQFRSTDKIDTCDSTLRHSWGNTRFEFCDADPLDKVQSVEFSEAGCDIGIPLESPENPGPRFSAPIWIKDLVLFREFGHKLLADRTVSHPSLADFEKSKTEVDLKLLWAYYVDHQSFSEIFEKYSRPENEIHFVSAADAKDCEQAMEIAAERNGTFVAQDEDDHQNCVFDYANQAWRKVTARKICGNKFRVEFHVADGDSYYLDQKLDPKKSTLPLQLYLKDLVTQGYELMAVVPPTESDRKTAREAREAERAAAHERDQYGSGHDPKVLESQAAAQDRLGNPAWAEQKAHSQLRAVENRPRKAAAAREKAIATKGMSSAETERWDSQRGEVVYAEFMLSQRPNDPERRKELADAKATLAAMSRQSVTAAKLEPKQELVVCSPAVRHERLRLTLLETLASIVAGSVRQGPPQLCLG